VEKNPQAAIALDVSCSIIMFIPSPWT
jgi:hypothetical protein